MKLLVVYNTAVKKKGNVSPLVAVILTTSLNVFLDLIKSFWSDLLSHTHNWDFEGSFSAKIHVLLPYFFFKPNKLTLIGFWKINDQIISQTIDSESRWSELPV